MPRAVTRSGVTTIYGPGEHVAGSFAASRPLDDSPESAAEARLTDEQTRTEWLKLLTRYEPELRRLHDSGDTDGATLLYRRIERSAVALVCLGDLERYLRAILAHDAPESERGWAGYFRLVCGGRDERTIRRWRSGELLIPDAAADYIGRIRDLTLVRAPTDAPYDETPGDSRRLRMEIVLD